MSGSLPPATRRALRRRLLAFYDGERRDLPWRRTADPYRVWVSEVMLQQTRVDVAVSYYERWMRLFPTLAALAVAERDQVLAAWAGLGYYARARNLHRAARIVVERWGGALPAEPAALRTLPGVGRYTAGAVASIAFGHAAPAVDGNVRRVLSRILDLPDPTPAELQREAAALVPGDRPGDFNQALMELGARVCTPRAPACPSCPVARLCRALAEGTVAERPAVRPRSAVPEFALGTALVAGGGALLLVCRAGEGLLGGMWEFPAAIADGEGPGRTARRLVRRLIGPGARAAGRGRPVIHAFSHRRHVYHPFRFTVGGRPAVETAGTEWSAGAWVDPADLASRALPAAQRRIAAAC